MSKRRLTPDQRAEVLLRLAALEPLDDIAQSYGVSRAVISRLALFALYTKELVLTPP